MMFAEFWKAATDGHLLSPVLYDKACLIPSQLQLGFRAFGSSTDIRDDRNGHTFEQAAYAPGHRGKMPHTGSQGCRKILSGNSLTVGLGLRFVFLQLPGTFFRIYKQNQGN